MRWTDFRTVGCERLVDIANSPTNGSEVGTKKEMHPMNRAFAKSICWVTLCRRRRVSGHKTNAQVQDVEILRSAQNDDFATLQ